MVKIRLQRFGTKKRPFYRVVAADSRFPRDGRFLEILGTYDPIKHIRAVEIKKERVSYWLENGARPTEKVKSLLAKQEASLI